MAAAPDSPPSRRPRFRSLPGLLGVIVLAIGGASLALGGDDTSGEVVRVIDGDTIVALVDGEEKTIRLLNIDTPETKHPDEPVQCLGPEASAFLADRLPPGTEIELEYDEERTDQYDRTLAGIYESDELVNAEIAAEGLGMPVYFAPNDRFLPPVRAASEEAQRLNKGLFSEDMDCTLAGQLSSLSRQVDDIPTTVEGDPAAALSEATTVVADVETFASSLHTSDLTDLGHRVLSGEEAVDYLATVQDRADDELARAEERESALEDLKDSYDEEQERLAQERREEEEREERERQERREEEEREERERQERRQQEQEPTSDPSSSGDGETAHSESSDEGSSSGGTSSDTSGHDGGSGDGGSPGTSEESPAGSTGGTSAEGSDSSDESNDTDGSSDSGCEPYGPEIPYADDGGYSGKRYGMPGGQTFRKCR